jgi:hypothetical protein
VSGACNVVSIGTNPSNIYNITIEPGDSIPSNVNLIIDGLTSPNNIPTDYSTISSFTANGSLISQNSSIIFTLYCLFPCNTC